MMYLSDKLGTFADASTHQNFIDGLHSDSYMDIGIGMDMDMDIQ